MPREKSAPKKAPTSPAKAAIETASQLALNTAGQMMKQAEEQWGQLMRNPQVLALVSATMEQSMNLQTKVQEVVTQTMKSMNMVTRDDLKALNRKLDAVLEQLEELNSKMEEPEPEPVVKPAPKKKAAPRRTAKKE
ncbi:MAG: hypothetical protein K1Y36_15260 [Blastocatellia bacterium]|nr:hypothetical protein [Blastocatellia bacterium]